MTDPSARRARFLVGHAERRAHHTGCTVIPCPPGTVAGVDVRGPAPGSRETDLIAADKPIARLDALLFTGGSAFGLAAADGVMRHIAQAGIGYPTPIKPRPPDAPRPGGEAAGPYVRPPPCAVTYN